MSVYTIETKQKFPVSIEILWDFISSPMNLKIITPSYMGFEVTSKNLPEKIYTGMLINYRVSPLFGIKLKWETEITDVKAPNFFTDEQRKGPYKYWHHEHLLEEIKGGVLMTDIVKYKPPFAIIGSAANSFVINKKLNGIFEFRRKKLEELFGKIH